MPFTDKTLTCADCGAQFVFTADDQEYHASRGFQNEPRRCPSCRRARRADRDESPGYGSSRQTYPAVCAECGRDTQLPFQPRGDRPVYCRECFSRREPARSRY